MQARCRRRARRSARPPLRRCRSYRVRSGSAPLAASIPAGFRAPFSLAALSKAFVAPDGVDLLFALVVDPGLDQVLREDPALEQELVILLQSVDRIRE